jgi:pimeloyl-ACP methyl ester carboxylesterase
LQKILQFLDLKEVVLFGHSDGGSIALIAAAKYPAKIKAIIAESPHIFVEDLTIAGIKKVVKLWHETDLNGINLKEKLEKYHNEKTEMVFRMWHETWLSEEYRSWNIEHFLPQIKCPALVIQGENDEYATMKQVDTILEKVSGISQKLATNSGHTPHKEAKNFVLQKVSEFIKLL